MLRKVNELVSLYGSIAGKTQGWALFRQLLDCTVACLLGGDTLKAQGSGTP